MSTPTTLAGPEVAAVPPVAPARPARRVPLWLAVLATSLPMFMATLDNLVMTSALPVIRADLGASVDQLGLVRERLHARLRDVHAPRGHAR